MNTIFSLCTHFLDWLAKTCHTTYTSISVVFNIYVQGLALAIPATWLLAKSIMSISAIGATAKNITLTVFALCQLLLVLIAFARYRPPLYNAFCRCMHDLQSSPAYSTPPTNS